MSGLVRGVARGLTSGQVVRGLGCVAIRSYGAPAHAHASSASKFNYDHSLACAPNAKVTTLSNGLRVATQTTGHDTATVGLFIDAGSRFETDESSGAANFVEHLVFKGTQNKTQAQIEAEFEKLGAEVGGYTARETTAFYAKTLAGNAAGAISLIGDCVGSANFDQATMDKEREAILRQMQATEDNLEQVVFDNLHATAYQGTPLARSVLGPSAHAHSLQRDHLVNYVKSNFTANRMVVAASGGVSHDDIVKAVEASCLGKFAAGGPAKVSSPRFTGSEMRVRNDEMPLAYVGLAFEGVGAAHPHFYALEVARHIIGSWDAGFQYADVRSSPLVKEILSDHVSTVTFRAFNHVYSDTGLFGVYYAGPGLQIDDAQHEVQSELVRIALAANDSDVMRAKASLKEELLGSLAGTTAACDDLGRSLIAYGRHMPAAEKVARIDAVTVADVRKVMTDYTYDKDPALAAVGAIEAVWDYNRIRSNTFWLRA